MQLLFTHRDAKVAQTDLELVTLQSAILRAFAFSVWIASSDRMLHTEIATRILGIFYFPHFLTLCARCLGSAIIFAGVSFLREQSLQPGNGILQNAQVRRQTLELIMNGALFPKG